MFMVIVVGVRMTEHRKKDIYYIAWFNLIIGLYNIYCYVSNDWWFNLVIGSLNIGVWVFNRNIMEKKK